MSGNNVAAGLPNRGKTYHGGTPTSIGRSVDLEGTESWFEDNEAQAAGPSTRRSGRQVLCRLVRNSSGIALLPNRVVSWESAYRGRRVDGYVTTTAAEPAGVVDDQLPAAGVADDDLFWIMRSGPALVKNDIAQNAIALGDVVVALTAATSQATTAGRIAAAGLTASLTGTTDGSLMKVVMHRLGRAMSAKTAAQTNQNILVDLDIMF